MVVVPTDTAGEAHLAWYFEKHLRYPFLDKDLESAAVRRIAAYGEALFAQVFGGEGSHDYRSMRDRAFDRCRVEVTGSAALHQLHWETLRDPTLGVPLAVRLPVTRRVSALGSKFQPPSGRPTVNILVVTARPDGPQDIGYRTISRPLLDTLRVAGSPITVELVRPGTWQALREHLRTRTERHGSGWYQVIHFDLHGAFSEYGPLEEARQAGRVQFSSSTVKPFDGPRGFLFFETAQQEKAEPVLAEDVASLLAEHRVPVAILNACQSAMQTGSEAGLAQRLAEAGVPVALGMAYSVTVSAAERAMSVLYGRIADGAELTVAVQAARRELFDHPARQAYFGQQLDLDDWMLPVMFAQQPLEIELRPMSGPEQALFFDRAAAVGDEPATEYGFIGRDLDIQAVEHRLLAGQNSNELLLQGMAGAGKSTLLAHLAWWWQRTGLVEHMFTFSYQHQAWTVGQIIREVRSKLLSPAEHAQADAMSDAAQIEQVAQLLRATRHLLIIDNAESITAAPAAIPHALSPEEQRKLKTLLSRLRGGRTLVLLGSRESETWLTSDGSGPGIYTLPGLDPQAASMLVERILARHDAGHYLQDEAERGALQELVALLGGYPLPLTVVLPVLAVSPPSAVLAELKEGGGGVDPTGLIHHAIEYSHGKLDPGLQNSLLLLAPFSSVVATGPLLESYHDLLLQHEAVQAMGPIDLAAALNQAVAVGLAAPHPDLTDWIQVQPVLPYFLRSRLQDQPALQAAIDQAHYDLYRALSSELYEMLTSRTSLERPAIARTISQAQCSNLSAALTYGLDNSQPIVGIVQALDEYLDQVEQDESRRQLLDKVISSYSGPASEVQQQELTILHDLAGHTAIKQHRFDDASEHYEAELQLLQATGDRKGQGFAYYQLGALAHDQHRNAEAETNYRKALEIFLEVDDRYETADIYNALGNLAHDQHRNAESETNYRKALEIFLDYGNQRRAAKVYNNIGIATQRQRRYAEAEANYRKALDIKLKSGDTLSAASTYHQLGTLAQDQERYAEAEANYRTALEIKLKYGDSAGSTYHQLGTLAQDQERYAEAEANYRKALDIGLKSGDALSVASTYHQLGTLAQDQERYAEAEANYRKALDIRREPDPLAASNTATRLGSVLAKLGRHPEATRTLLYAALTWRQGTEQWPVTDLKLLHQERAVIGSAEFAELIRSDIPSDLVGELIGAVEATGNLENVDEPGQGGNNTGH
jgi:tetratricopeptide (TPR) repeat protein